MNLAVTVIKSSICAWQAEANEPIKVWWSLLFHLLAGNGCRHLHHDEKERVIKYQQGRGGKPNNSLKANKRPILKGPHNPKHVNSVEDHLLHTNIQTVNRPACSSEKIDLVERYVHSSETQYKKLLMPQFILDSDLLFSSQNWLSCELKNTLLCWVCILSSNCCCSIAICWQRYACAAVFCSICEWAVHFTLPTVICGN